MGKLTAIGVPLIVFSVLVLFASPVHESPEPAPVMNECVLSVYELTFNTTGAYELSMESTCEDYSELHYFRGYSLE